jgi:hypothetical protein
MHTRHAGRHWQRGIYILLQPTNRLPCETSRTSLALGVEARLNLLVSGSPEAVILKVSVKEISRRLHRDPSIISQLYAAYAATRHHEKETRLAHIVLTRLARGYLWLP